MYPDADPRRPAPRCGAVTRELAAPCGLLDPIALAAHLAECPRCASQAAEARRLDRIWEATRPPSPSVSSWESAWAHAARATEAPATRLRIGPRRSRRAVAVLVLAQAAAVLVAATLLLSRGPTSVAQTPSHEIPSGQVTTLHLDEHNRVAVDSRPEEAISETDTVSPLADLLNHFESLDTRAS